MSGNDYNLFFPVDGKERLTKRYPELGRMEQFRTLKHHELEFVWLYANEKSLFASIKDLHEKARKSFETAWRNLTIDGKEYQAYCSLTFPDHIKTAIDRMARFRPDIRSRALEALESAYETCIEVLRAPIPGEIILKGQGKDNEDQYVDVTPAIIKQVMDAKQKAREELPGIISQIEEGFGVTISTKDGSEDSAIVQFIRDKKLKK